MNKWAKVSDKVGTDGSIVRVYWMLVERAMNEPVKNYGWLKIILFYPVFYLSALWNLIRKRRDHWIYQDWFCGSHSGFRVCCRLYYIFYWSFVHSGEMHRVIKLKKLCNEIRKNITSEAEYIECSVCRMVKRKPVKIIDCKCGEDKDMLKSWSFSDPSRWKKQGS